MEMGAAAPPPPGSAMGAHGAVGGSPPLLVAPGASEEGTRGRTWDDVAMSPSTSRGLHGSETLPSAAVSPPSIFPSVLPRAGGGRWMLKRYPKALGDVHRLQWDPGRDLWLQLFSLL